MESEEPYIPYEERTPKELCRDIIHRAEKLFIKNDRKALIVIAVIFLVFAILTWRFNFFGEKWWLFAWVIAEVVVYSVFFFINKKLIKEMNLTANPKQFLSMVQRLCKSVKLRNFICFVLSFWPSLSFLQITPDLGKMWWWVIISIIPALFIAWLVVITKPERLIDSDFCDDVNELEYRLQQ